MFKKLFNRNKKDDLTKMLNNKEIIERRKKNAINEMDDNGRKLFVLTLKTVSLEKQLKEKYPLNKTGISRQIEELQKEREDINARQELLLARIN